MRASLPSLHLQRPVHGGLGTPPVTDDADLGVSGMVPRQVLTERALVARDE